MESAHNFQLNSPAFVDGDIIPDRYTCKGMNISPPLVIRGTPEGTTSLALIMHDPDAPGGDFLHWTVWNLHTNVKVLRENQLPDDASQGTNSYGKVQYNGPCPPPMTTHHYVFDLYALDSQLDLPEGASREELEEAIADHQVAHVALTGTFGQS